MTFNYNPLGAETITASKGDILDILEVEDFMDLHNAGFISQIDEWHEEPDVIQPNE